MTDTTDPPAVSVVMTAYNAGRYVGDAVESILGQTFADFEFVVVDDGSTDRTPAVLRAFAGRDSRVRIIRQPNGGVVAAANAGLAVARGPLVARMDADDVSLPGRLAAQFDYFTKHPDCVLLGTGVTMIEPYGSPVGRMPLPLTHEKIDAQLLTAAGGTALVQPSTMMRASAVRQVGGYRGSANLAEDMDLFLRLAEVGRVANLPDVLLHYRRHPASLSQTRHDQQEATTAAIADARRRRGLSPLSDGSVARWTPAPADRQARVWGWAALRAGNVSVARRHAWAAVWRGPWSAEAWRLVYCAARGH